MVTVTFTSNDNPITGLPVTDYTFWDFQGYCKLTVVDTVKSSRGRGSADAYYGRKSNPHYRYKDSRTDALYIEVDVSGMSDKDVAAYRKGFNEETGSKDWK